MIKIETKKDNLEINTKFLNPKTNLEKATNYFIMTLLASLFLGFSISACFFTKPETLTEIITICILPFILFGIMMISLKIFYKSLFQHFRQIQQGVKESLSLNNAENKNTQALSQKKN